MGHKVTLLTGAAEGSPEQFDFNGVKVTRSQYYDLNWLVKSGFQEVDENVDEITIKYLNRVKPDVIHTHNMHFFSAQHINVVERYCQRHKIPLILTVHNAWSDKLYLDLTTKIKWDRLISISHYISRELRAVGVPEKKITIIHHGIDQTKFHPGKVNPKILRDHKPLVGKKKIVFNPARLGLAKGCDITIQAFKLVKAKHPDAYLLMSGSGNIIDWQLSQNKDIAYLVSLMKHLKVEKDAYVNVFSLEQEMPDLYRLADIIVYPSSADEPYGLAMLEAMASGKPIVVTESGGMPEIIQNDVNGYVIPRRNHEALAEKIIWLLDNPDIGRNLGHTGRQQVEECYTKEIYAKNVVDVYLAELKNKKK